MTNLTFRVAHLGDVAALLTLVNSAYQPISGYGGWTDETRFVQGTRINTTGLEKLLLADNSVVLLGLQGYTIIACVHLEKSLNHTHLGMLAVDPALQAAGIGKQLLAEAEAYAHDHFQAEQMVLIVIELRTELIAFYERRGYQQTDSKIDYALVCGDTCAGKIPGLQLTVMEKHLV